jgi:peroxiredoxin
MKSRANLLFLGVALLAIAGIGVGAESKSVSPRRAPDFTLPDCQGNKVSLEAFRGRIVLLQFFQTRCPACQREAPLLEEVYRKFKDRGVSVIAVSHDAGGAEVVREFARNFDVTYPLLLGDLEIAVRYLGITPQHSSFDIPRLFLIDRKGYIVRDLDPAGDIDFSRDEKGFLQKAIESLLNSSQPSEKIGNRE